MWFVVARGGRFVPRVSWCMQIDEIGGGGEREREGAKQPIISYLLSSLWWVYLSCIFCLSWCYFLFRCNSLLLALILKTHFFTWVFTVTVTLEQASFAL